VLSCAQMAVADPLIASIVASYRARLEQALGKRLVELRLFGSRARGDAHHDSDIDVAVILDDVRDFGDRTFPMELAGEMTVETGFAISPFVLSVRELDELRQREVLIAERLDREGIAF
jgi:uncharacterized protein